MPLHVLSTVVFIIRRSYCIIHHLVSSHSVGVRLVRRWRVSQPAHQTATYRGLSLCAPDGHLQSVTIQDDV